MKGLILVLFTAFLLVKCQPAPMHPDNPHHEDPAEITSYKTYHGDTCNRTDAKGRKQGKWFKFSKGKIQDTAVYKDGKLISGRNRLLIRL